MPGFDGTGPRGAGPMTGAGQGYCLLKVPDGPCEPLRGLAGREGRPVTIASFPGREGSLAHLNRQAVCLENALKHVRRRIQDLETDRVTRMTGRQD